jgi:hypothetical protein
MITPEEKAIGLVEVFWTDVEDLQKYECVKMTKNMAKQCALIAVDEILTALYEYDNRTEKYLKEQGIEYQSYELQNMDADFRYWLEVKSEIEKL